MEQSKKTIAVIFGGQSSEHEISLLSAANIIDEIDVDKFDLLLIGITKEGHWLLVNSADDIRSGDWYRSRTEAVISPDATKKCVILKNKRGNLEIPVDGAFPILHGLYGEDGTIQGLLELAQIPYVGCDVLTSAICMDKLTTKLLVKELGIRQAAYVPVLRWQFRKDPEGIMDQIEASLAYPVFVKPSCAGSSMGVSKAGNREELLTALKEAAKNDRKILVEEKLSGHEVECAVLGGGDKPVRSSGVGEILPDAEFYDYNSKYNSTTPQTVTDPELPEGSVKEVKEDAEKIFNAVGGYGLARVDFFVTDEGEVIFNEINTFPGFTSISMYPSLWEAAGIPIKELITVLISLSFNREGHFEEIDDSTKVWPNREKPGWQYFRSRKDKLENELYGGD